MTTKIGTNRRILVITRNLPPLMGGMERLVWHILDELRIDYDVHAIGPRDSAGQAPEGVSMVEVAESPLWRFLLGMTSKTIREAVQLRAAFVVAGSGLTAPFAWLAARLVGTKTIVYLHWLDIKAQRHLYRAFWLPIIRRCDIVLVNSHPPTNWPMAPVTASVLSNEASK